MLFFTWPIPKMIFTSHILLPGQEDNVVQEETRIPCEKCQRIFLPNSILMHITKSEKCKKFYGPRFDEMKKEQKRERDRKKKQRRRNRNGTKEELKRQRDSYAKDPAKRKKKQDHYQENREELSKEYRDRAREAKMDSEANDRKYHEAIKIGPLFVCVCCHCALFRENVKIFNDTLQNKIMPSVLEDSCIFDVRFKDPLGNDNHYVCFTCFNTMKNKKNNTTT